MDCVVKYKGLRCEIGVTTALFANISLRDEFGGV
jgi:hypothetical protein